MTTKTHIYNYSSVDDNMVFAYLWQIYQDSLSLPVEFPIDGIRVSKRETKTGITVYQIEDI